MKRTKEELMKQIKEHDIKRWTIHNCSMCGYPCGYLIEGDNIFYDCGCDCVSYRDIHPSSIEELTADFNRNRKENNPNISDEYLKEVDRIFKFN